jgi:hypothetical protein
MNLVHASPVASLFFFGASVHVCLAHPAQSKTLPALSFSSPHARVLLCDHFSRALHRRCWRWDAKERYGDPS